MGKPYEAGILRNNALSAIPETFSHPRNILSGSRESLLHPGKKLSGNREKLLHPSKKLSGTPERSLHPCNTFSGSSERLRKLAKSFRRIWIQNKKSEQLALILVLCFIEALRLLSLRSKI